MITARHAEYFTELLVRFDAEARGADEQVWVERLTPAADVTVATPDFDNLRTAFDHWLRVGDIDAAFRVVVSLPMLIIRIGVSPADWADRLVEIADPGHPHFVAAVGVCAECAWYVGSFDRLRSLGRMVHGRRPHPEFAYSAYPRDWVAAINLVDGDPALTLGHYEGELAQAREAGDPLRLLWVLYYITVCHVARGEPGAGLSAAREAMDVAAGVSNPTGSAMALCALGRALSSTEPEQALSHYRRAPDIAVSVCNNWLISITTAESAAIRAEHGDAVDAARMFLDAIDVLERSGPVVGAFLWDALRDVTRLLRRTGARDEAVALHRAIVAAGRTPPLTAAELHQLGPTAGPVLSGTEAVELVRTALRRMTLNR